MILLIFLFPIIAFSAIEAEVGAYSNFIWRGTTFTENQPAIQGELETEIHHGFYLAGFFSNAKFSDEAMGQNANVTSEMDLTIGKNWQYSGWEIQGYYSHFYFPGANVFDTDEWNLQIKHSLLSLELSLMDDYFGYHSRYTYVRIGKEWLYKESLEGALFIGYNGFDRPKGSIKTWGTFTTLNGAGNPDYLDVYFVNRKKFENHSSAELAINWTNRKEYLINGEEVSIEKSKDFAIIVAYIIPFTI